MFAVLAAAVVSAAPVAVHSYTSGEAQFSANTWLVETARGVVVIDTQFTVSEGKAVRKKLESLGKPLLAVLLTHAHPDHVNGTAEVLAGQKVPVVALAGVKTVLDALDAPKRAYWGPQLKGEYPKTTVFPTQLVKPGETVTFDGVAFTAHDLGEGESADETVWATGAHAFVGDLVMYKVHPWLAEGHSGAWLTSLERAKALTGFEKVYPGHGVAGGRELFDWQRGYLEAYRKNVKELAKGQPTLSDQAKKELEARMEKVLPKAGLAMLVAMSADAVAAELK
ncbi:MAG: MBL fold metallo-hydrolase [Myxococcales bacterium]|nr:MBL fold metallo-hydrolase [Myxococcales bacterium]